jgi:hypothetical protein
MERIALTLGGLRAIHRFEQKSAEVIVGRKRAPAKRGGLTYKPKD